MVARPPCCSLYSPDSAYKATHVLRIPPTYYAVRHVRYAHIRTTKKERSVLFCVTRAGGEKGGGATPAVTRKTVLTPPSGSREAITPPSLDPFFSLPLCPAGKKVRTAERPNAGALCAAGPVSRPPPYLPMSF